LKQNAVAVSLLLLTSAAAGFSADLPALPPEEIVQNYCAAQQQAPTGKVASMDMDIQASLPGLKKEGRFHALRKINPFGRISYLKASFEGDNAVKSQVVVRYLQAEAEAQQDESDSIAVTPANYKFQYKGQKDAAGRAVHVFQLTPKKKKKGLFKGEIWIDAATYLPVREEGNLIKSPSIFVKKVAFVRTFDIRDGISVPLQVQSVVNTVFGSAELKVDFSNFALDDAEDDGDGESSIR
jgi:MucB/RseB N-terminal domain